MVIRNEHNPILLYYHLLEDRGNVFHWEYLAQTHAQWKVKITKLKSTDQEPTIGEIASKDYRKAELFGKLGIDYCCSGKKTLKQACQEIGMEEEVLEEIYQTLKRHKDKDIYPFETWEVDFLMDYIISTHHSYIKYNAERLSRLAIKVADRHGDANPELLKLSEHLKLFLNHLKDNIATEEKEIFPALKTRMAKKTHRRITEERLTIVQAVSAIEEGHKATGKALKCFRKLTQNYKLPKDACISYTHFFALLLEFEMDLVQHAHLENNLLIPKVTAMRKN